MLIMAVPFCIETTGIDPYRDKVLLIGMKVYDGTKLLRLWKEGDEGKMISDAFGILEQVDDTIVGYNSLLFDIPFLHIRLNVLGRHENQIWEKVYKKKWFDLHQYLGVGHHSLQYWTYRFKITEGYSDMTSDGMRVAFEKGEYDKIIRYSIDHLDAIDGLFNLIMKRRPFQLKP